MQTPPPRPRPLSQCDGLLNPLLELDAPLMRVLAAIEQAGIALDLGVLACMRAPMERQLAWLEVRRGLTRAPTRQATLPRVHEYGC